MNTKFNTLPNDKQMRIINSAMHEFGIKGYKSASTDAIAAGAGISKGALFNYFGSKRDLFDYVIEYAYSVPLQEYFAEFDFSETDFVERMKISVSKKIELMQIYPDMFEFFVTSKKETDPDISEMVTKIRSDTIDYAYERLFTDIDYTKFRDDVDTLKAINMIIWVFKGFGEHIADKITTQNLALTDIDIQSLQKDTNEYIDIAKAVFYK